MSTRGVSSSPPSPSASTGIEEVTVMNDSGEHEVNAVAALRRLGREPAGASFASRVLAGGLSGSVVHHVALDGQDMVLKVTLPGKDRTLTARACREVWFYRDLATLVPVRVPRVLGFDVSEAEGAVLLLAAHRPSPAPDDWTERGYIEIARQLGRLHATFWDKTTGSELPAWLRARPEVTPDQCQAAARLWRALGKREDLSDALAPYARSRESLLMNIPALERQMPTMPATLCHGDFHADNLLQDPAGEWIWADWQEVHLGPGVDDFAFFWQRAFAATDTPPPYDAMLQAYAAGLATVDGTLISRERVDRALAWAELRSWLVAWPGYLRALSPARIARVLRRIETLMSHLDLESHL